MRTSPACFLRWYERAPVWLVVTAVLGIQGCASGPSAPAQPKERAATHITREKAEQQFNEAFELRDRKEHLELDLVSYVGMPGDRLVFTSSAGRGTYTCVFHEMGPTQVAPSLLTRAIEVKPIGCNREFVIFYWDDKAANRLAAAIEALRRMAL
jgi:hypothetical protein